MFIENKAQFEDIKEIRLRYRKRRSLQRMEASLNRRGLKTK